MSERPLLSDYHGGGVILNGYTTISNVIDVCNRNAVPLSSVTDLIAKGYEVVIHKGQIVAARPRPDSSSEGR